MLTSHGRFNLRQTFSFVALLLVCAFVAFPSAAAPRPCDCENLEAIQTHLRNAIHLQKQYSGKIADLEKAARFRPGIADREYQEFTGNLSVTAPVGETGPTRVTYISHGDVLTLAGGEVKGEGLCLRTQTSEAQLRALESGVTCAEIGTIVRAHEDYHVTECARLGYILYRMRPVAQLAAEEAAAYGRQATALRALIGRVLERSTVVMEAQTHVLIQGPPNPLYTAVKIDFLGNIPVKLIPASGAMIKLEGQGEYSRKVHVVGNCRITTPMPQKAPARVGIETDGLDAQIRYSIKDTLPTLGMKCAVHEAWGSGASMPVPIPKIDSSSPTNLPLRNGAEYVLDMAQIPGAQTMRQAGIQMSGASKMRLVIECRRR